MCRELTYLIPFVFVLGASLTGTANADDPSLVLYLPFDEGQGVPADYSAYGHEVELVNDPQWVDGYSGHALEFDGTNYVRVPINDTLQLRETFSVAFWVKRADAQPATWNYMVAGGSLRWAVIFNADGNVYVWTRSGGSWGQRLVTTMPLTTEWTHIAMVYDIGSGVQLYFNGEEKAGEGAVPPAVDEIDGSIMVGARNPGSEFFAGVIDEVRLYDRALTEDEIPGTMTGEPLPYAFGPDPKDGAMLEATWVNLGWRAGDFAVSHDVYLADNFDDVNSGSEGAFQGNLGTTSLIAGFAGFPFPDGLVPGTTYYWRIDEVNDSEPNSPWKGDVWSFTVPPKEAYGPVPAEGARFVAVDASLGWTPGFGAKLHTVYFGDNADEVAGAAGGAPVSVASFTPPGSLEPEKTYYWRVDEFDAAETHKGDVWSFTTAGEGGGVKGQYFQGMAPGGIPALVRTDPQIDFNWGSDAPDPAVGEDNFSCRWTGEVEAVFTETYTFYTNSDDGVRLWIDGKQLVNNWTDHGTTENSGMIDLVAGNTYSVVMEHYENGGGAVAQLSWSSPRTPKELVPAAALSFLVHAYDAKPSNGSQGLNLMSKLSWKAGDSAASHDVYLGTDADAVANATKASPEFKGTKAVGEESLDPGLLAFDTTYYWRVDEVNNTNPESPWVGNVWSFWTGDFLVVDDFESYDDIDPALGESGLNRIFDKWLDGFGTLTNGALVGNDLPPYAEQSVVHGGAQSMIYRYDNTGKTSEATLTLAFPTDWTAEGVTKLSLWFRGASSNGADRIFVALGNSVVYHDDPAATQDTGWNEWVIDLQEFATQGVDMTSVGSITLGIGTRGTPAADGGTGVVYIDDITLVK